MSCSAPVTRFGQGSVSGGGSNVTFAYPEPFPNACDVVHVLSATGVVSTVSFDAHGFTVSVLGTLNFSYIALGH